jgi:hypothetical protein
MDTMAPIMDDAEHSFITTAGPPIGQMPHQYAPIPSYEADARVAARASTTAAAVVGTGYGGHSATQEAKNPFEPNNRYNSYGYGAAGGAGTYAYQENPLRSTSSSSGGGGGGRSFTVSDKEKFAIRGVQGDERGVRIPSRTSFHSDSEHSQPTDEENMQYYSNPMNSGTAAASSGRSGRSSGGLNSSLISSTSERSQSSLRSSGRSRGFGGFSNDWTGADSEMNPFTADLGTDLITEERLMRPDELPNVSYNSQGQGQREPVGPGPLNFNPNNMSNMSDRDRRSNSNRGPAPAPANQGPLFRGSMG